MKLLLPPYNNKIKMKQLKEQNYYFFILQHTLKYILKKFLCSACIFSSYIYLTLFVSVTYK